MPREKVVLAYSGGLDTACILKTLIQSGYDVIAYVADVGQQEDFDEVADRARRTGAVDVRVEDLKREFVTDFIYPAIAGNAVYENRYLLGTSLARPVIARRQVEIALDVGAEAVAHGATGKGNDQVRFELAFAALAPGLRIIAPWKDPDFLARFQGRSDLLAFAREHDIPVEATVEKPYSSDENLMHRSYEAGLLEDPDLAPPPDMFKLTRSIAEAPDTPEDLVLHFEDALPVRVENVAAGVDETDPVALFEYLNDRGGAHGIGRVDMVENRFVGIKSRGVYETPGGTVLHHALRDLEGIAMDREVLRLRDMLSPRFAEIIYNGFWFSPEMDFIRAAFGQSERLIDGQVRVRLHKGNVIPMGRVSHTSLYDKDLSSMDVAGGYDQEDARGFIRINALRLKAHKLILRRTGEDDGAGDLSAD
ncbi:MAG: argininosuccinate synthase [Gemmatimonadetes bacterium]|nr:argininosuccinate synthase [Gemmatimonadota bacterium]MBT8403017.1 argininosuccinate synthase [Gemmatimonadota bacterium]NNF39175.1 argininosuccinate synthase [Gemmatimonadota bacterium]NNK64870.1 argininosuccinate synthase [Gemmatimonadota bacterium]